MKSGNKEVSDPCLLTARLGALVLGQVPWISAAIELSATKEEREQNTS